MVVLCGCCCRAAEGLDPKGGGVHKRRLVCLLGKCRACW